MKQKDLGRSMMMMFIFYYPKGLSVTKASFNHSHLLSIKFIVLKITSIVRWQADIDNKNNAAVVW